MYPGTAPASRVASKWNALNVRTYAQGYKSPFKLLLNNNKRCTAKSFKNLLIVSQSHPLFIFLRPIKFTRTNDLRKNSRNVKQQTKVSLLKKLFLKFMKNIFSAGIISNHILCLYSCDQSSFNIVFTRTNDLRKNSRNVKQQKSQSGRA